MMIAVASGKGGTGKTTIATSLALAASEAAQLLDCDVEEPNAHIFIKPEITSKKLVFIKNPQVDSNKCNGCGKCRDICSYNAIAILQNRMLFYQELCHSCGACSYICPQKAITEVDREIGYLEFGKKNNLEFIHGYLNVGEVLATPVIKQIKTNINRDKTVIIDCPPGTSCPMLEAVRGSNYCILVTEPTPFGLNDLILAVEALRKLTIPFGVVINRADLGDQGVEDYCDRENIPILLKIPFEKEIAVSYSKGVPLVEALPEYTKQFRKLLQQVQR